MIMIISAPSLSIAGEPDADEIIGKTWDYMRGNTSVSVVHMTVHRADWERKTTIKAGPEDAKTPFSRSLPRKKIRAMAPLKKTGICGLITRRLTGWSKFHLP